MPYDFDAEEPDYTLDFDDEAEAPEYDDEKDFEFEDNSEDVFAEAYDREVEALWRE